jgi:hypothetical protein
VAVLNFTAVFDDDVGVRLEQADDLVVGGDRLALKNTTFGLRDDAANLVPGEEIE